MRLRTLFLGSAVLLGVLGFGSCQKEADVVTYEDTITADIAIRASAVTKTVIVGEDGTYTPYWTKDDKLGVFVELSSTEYEFESSLEDEGATATFFKGGVSIPSGSHYLYAYYPYEAGVTQADMSCDNRRIRLPEEQSPLLTSFDGKADIMVAKPWYFERGSSLMSTDNMEFGRLMATVKVVFGNVADIVNNEPLQSFKLTAGETYKDYVLTGESFLNLEECTYTLVGDTDSANDTDPNKMNYVTAVYDDADDFQVNGQNAVYAVVYPQTITNGSKLHFYAETEFYIIEKEITVSQPEGVVLRAGDITVMNISLDASNVREKGGKVLLSEDFASATNGNHYGYSGGIDQAWTIPDANGNFISGSATQAGGAIRVGAAMFTRNITTKPLNLSRKSTVIIKLKGYDGNAGSVTITAGSQSKTVPYVTTSKMDDFRTYYVNFDEEAENTSVIISSVSGSTLVYIGEVEIVTGTVEAPAPPIFTAENVTGVPAAGITNATLTFSITNNDNGYQVKEDLIAYDGTVVTAASVSGTSIKYTVADNTNPTPRSGYIRVTLNDPAGTVATISVSQEATSVDTRHYALLDRAPSNWAGTYIIGVHTDALYALRTVGFRNTGADYVKVNEYTAGENVPYSVITAAAGGSLNAGRCEVAKFGPDTYTIKVKFNDSFLQFKDGNPGTLVTSSTSFAAACEWKFEYDSTNNYVKIINADYPDYVIAFDASKDPNSFVCLEAAALPDTGRTIMFKYMD